MKEQGILKGVATSNMIYVFKDGNNNEKYYAEEIHKRYWNKIAKKKSSLKINTYKEYLALMEKYPNQFEKYIHDWIMGRNFKKKNPELTRKHKAVNYYKTGK